jgi:Family of unknown function (DUF6428)
MTLDDLQSTLLAHPEHAFQLQLPRGEAVPVSFHVTEVARIEKRFIDCGGRLHEGTVCQLQVWVGPDDDHRLATKKLGAILAKSRDILRCTGELPIEIEYEDGQLSQYPIERWSVTSTAVVLHLTTKHTDCLAKDVCLLPPASGGNCGCGPGGCDPISNAPSTEGLLQFGRSPSGNRKLDLLK